MIKRLIVLLLALLVSIAVIACTKKVDNEVASSDPSSLVDAGTPGSNYDDANNMTSSELEEIESEVMQNSNISISMPGTSSDTSSNNGGSSDTTPSGSTSSSNITGFY